MFLNQTNQTPISAFLHLSFELRSCVVFVTKCIITQKTEGRSPDRAIVQRKQQGYAPLLDIFHIFSATKTMEQCSFINQTPISAFLHLSFELRSCVVFVTKCIITQKMEGRSPDRAIAQRKQQGYAPLLDIFHIFSATKTMEQCSFKNQTAISASLHLSFEQRSCVVFVTKCIIAQKMEGRSPDLTNAQRKQQGYAPLLDIFHIFSATKTTEQCSFKNQTATSAFLHLSFELRSCVVFVTKCIIAQKMEGRSPDPTNVQRKQQGYAPLLDIFHIFSATKLAKQCSFFVI